MTLMEQFGERWQGYARIAASAELPEVRCATVRRAWLIE